MSSPLGRNKVNAFFKSVKNKIGFFVIPIMLLIVGFGIYNILNNQRTANAANCTWTGNNSGDFSDSGNWSGCGGVPQNGDNITFPSSASE